MVRNRPSKDAYYFGIAEAVSKRSTCLRRQYGAVIIKDDEVIATGYNGSPRGSENCCDSGICYRIDNDIPRGTQYEKCQSVHAEQNAIISARRSDMKGGILYLYCFDVILGKAMRPEPCLICQRLIKNAGLEVKLCQC